MDTFNRAVAREQSVRNVFARRDEALRWLDDARRDGKRKEVRRLEGLLRKFDKLIAQYGWDRHAQGS
jgi:hypothetical protein